MLRVSLACVLHCVAVVAFVCLDETCLRTAAALKMMALTYEFKGNMKKRVGGIKFGATAEFARLGVPALFMVCILFLVKNLSLNSPCIAGTGCVL